MSQDTAFRVGATLVYVAGATWLDFDDERRLICIVDDPHRLWFETWSVLHARYKGISRMWIGGRALRP
jgi:hypothetical protein